MSDKISREELKQSIDAGEVTVVEALPALYFEDEHLPGAININHDQVEQLAPELLTDKDAAIVTYCASSTCRNSETAAAKLEALGYTDVRVYVGGKEDWTQAGLPVESGAVPA